MSGGIINSFEAGRGMDATTITLDASDVFTSSNLESHLRYSFKVSLVATSTISSSSSITSTSYGGNSIGVACFLKFPFLSWIKYINHGKCFEVDSHLRCGENTKVIRFVNPIREIGRNG